MMTVKKTADSVEKTGNQEKSKESLPVCFPKGAEKPGDPTEHGKD